MVARKEAIMNNVRSELAVANAQELVNVRISKISTLIILNLCLRKLVNVVTPSA